MLTAADLARWMALYAATGVCCAIAMVLSVSRLTIQVHRERLIQTTQGWRSWALLAPRLWWRWQKIYLTSTPVTLLVVAAFAYSLDWSN